MTYPELNTDLLQDLVKWAEFDSTPIQEARIQQWIVENGLGEWRQSSWGMAEVVGIKDLDDDPVADPKAVAADVKQGVCGSAHCMAGGAVVASGYRLVYNDSPYLGYLGDDGAGRETMVTSADQCIKSRWVERGVGKGGYWVDAPGAEPEDIDEVAARILGLDVGEHDLFAGDNSIDDIKRIVNELCADRGLAPMYELEDAEW